VEKKGGTKCRERWGHRVIPLVGPNESETMTGNRSKRLKKCGCNRTYGYVSQREMGSRNEGLYLAGWNRG